MYMETKSWVSLLVVAVFLVAIGEYAVLTGQVIEPPGNGAPEPVCMEDWDCTEWSECTGSVQTRECTDLNGCGTELSKPAETSDCEVQEEEWATLYNFGGDRDKTSKPFTIDNDLWRIVWYCSDKEGRDNEGEGYARVSIYIDGTNTSISHEFAYCEDFQNRPPREIRIEEGGDFYIKAQANELDIWSVKVQERVA